MLKRIYSKNSSFFMSKLFIFHFLVSMIIFALIASLFINTNENTFSDVFSYGQLYVVAAFFAIIVTFITDGILNHSPKRIILTLGFSFLYIPMLMLIIYSFNQSKLVTIWSEFSTKWYGVLFHDTKLLSAVGLSFFIAFASATIALILGTLASYAMVRFKQFKGSNLFSFMITAPLVMPDIITGLALLLLFVGMGQLIGWPQQRGATTILLAHATFCTSYVTIVMSARLRELDRSIEEAAMDLGANPLKVFFIITLPMIIPSLISAWLLAFTLSLDDVVIASFIAGPNSETLPILVFSRVKLGVNPTINALATIILTIVGIIGFISWILMRRKEKKRLKEIQRIK